MKLDPSLVTIFKGMASTPTQKALLGAVGCLGGTMLLAESGLVGFLFEKLQNLGWSISFCKDEGVSFGNVFLKDSDRVKHTHIVGSPGSGKTEATKTLIFEDIRRGRGCIEYSPCFDGVAAPGRRQYWLRNSTECTTAGSRHCHPEQRTNRRSNQPLSGSDPFQTR